MEYDLPDFDLEDQERCEEQVKYELINPAIARAGWPMKQLKMEYVTAGQIMVDSTNCVRDKRVRKLDYLLLSKGGKGLAVVEAKKESYPVSHGIQQAIGYAKMVCLPFAYSTNGHGFYEHDMITGTEREFDMDSFPTESDLLERWLKESNLPEESSLNVPFFTEMGGKVPRYYQRNAINRVLEAIEAGQRRILVVMATGTGKTFVSMQIIHKLINSRKNVKILFLVDRNGLVDQAMANEFKHFQNLMTKVREKTLNSAYTLYMSLYHQLVSEDGSVQPYEQFKPDFFDFIIIDECHRGSAKEDSEWHKILEYYSSAVHIGLTATPKEDKDVSTSGYFGEAVYTYSYRQGVEDGFLAPFIAYDDTTTVDLHWEPGDKVLDSEGNRVEGPFDFRDYDRRVILEDRNRLVAERTVDWLRRNGVYSRTIVFCETEEHALRMRNEISKLMPEEMAKNPDYCVRITGSDKEGLKLLESFNRKDTVYPVVVTTSDLLTTGYDCFMTKLIVIDKLVASPTEFKQIIGRGSRLDTERGKFFFTILDFRHATTLIDGDWDGHVEPYVGDVPRTVIKVVIPPREDRPQFKKIYIKTPVPVEIEQELVMIYGPGKVSYEDLKDFSRKNFLGSYPSLKDFLSAWNSERRKSIILRELEKKGVLVEDIKENGCPDTDIFDLLIQMAYGGISLTKTQRVERTGREEFLDKYNDKAREVLKTLLEVYATDPEGDLSDLNILRLNEFEKYGSMLEIVDAFGGKKAYLEAVSELQSHLYA